MLTIIQPKAQKLNASKVEAFLNLLKKYQGIDLSLSQRKQATFIIVENGHSGIYGGAVLYPQHIWLDYDDSDLQEDMLRMAFVTFRPLEQEFWIARVCFCLEANASSPLTLAGIELCKRFYQELYKAFLEVGKQNDIEFLGCSLMALPPFTPLFDEDWPHRTPVSYSSSFDAIRYSILSLKGTKFFPRKSRRIDKRIDHTSAAHQKVDVTSEERVY